MIGSEEIKQLPSVYEGGPQSSELLPPLEHLTSIGIIVDQTISLIERQTGLDLGTARTLRIDPYVQRRPRPHEMGAYDAYMTREGNVSMASVHEPLAQSPDGWTAQSIIRVEPNPDSRLSGSYLPTGINSEKFGGHYIQYIVVSGNQKDQCYIALARVVDPDVNAGFLVLATRDKKGIPWSIDLIQYPSEDATLTTRRNYKETTYIREGWFGPKRPVEGVLREVIGDTIDRLPRKGALEVNQGYYKFRDHQYGTIESHALK